MDLTAEELEPGHLDPTQPLEALVSKLSSLSSALTTPTALPDHLPVTALCKDTAFLLSSPHEEVQVLALCCMADLYRLCAPNPPFTKDQSMALFRLICKRAALLRAPPEDPKSISFIHALKVVAEISALALGFKYKEAGVVGEVIEALLGNSSLALGEEAARAIEAIVLTGLEEASPPPKEVLYPVLISMTSFNRDHRRYTIAQRALSVCSSKTILAIDELLASAFSSTKGLKCEALRSPERYEVLSHLYKLQPDFVLQALTQLPQDFDSKDKTRVRKSLELTAKLASCRGSNLASIREYLFAEFVKRFEAQDKEIRAAMVEWAGWFFKHWNQGTETVLTAVRERLGDTYEKVRRLAVQMIGKAGQKRDLSLETLELVSERLRDKEAEVRREARITLMSLYEEKALEPRLRSASGSDLRLIPDSLVLSYSYVPLVSDQVELVEGLDRLIVGERTKEDAALALYWFFVDLEVERRQRFSAILHGKKYWMGKLIEMYALKGEELAAQEPLFSAHLSEPLSLTQLKSSLPPKHSPLVLDLLRDMQFGKRFLALADESASLAEKLRIKQELKDLATEKDTLTLKLVEQLIARTVNLWISADQIETFVVKQESAFPLLYCTTKVYTSLIHPISASLLSHLSPALPSEAWALLRIAGKSRQLTATHRSQLESLLPAILTLEDPRVMREITAFAAENYPEDFLEVQIIDVILPNLRGMMERQGLLLSRLAALGEALRLMPESLGKRVEELVRFVASDLMVEKTRLVGKKEQTEVSFLGRAKLEGLSILAQFARNQLHFSAAFNAKRVFQLLFRITFNLTKYLRKTHTSEVLSLSQCFSRLEETKTRAKALGEMLSLLTSMRDLRELMTQRRLVGLSLLLLTTDADLKDKFVKFLVEDTEARSRILPQAVALLSILAASGGRQAAGSRTALSEVIQELSVAQGEGKSLEVYVVYLVIVLAGHELYAEEGLAKRCISEFLKSLPAPLNSVYLISLAHLLLKLDLADPRPCTTDLPLPAVKEGKRPLSLSELADMLSEAVRELNPGEVADRRDRKVLIPGHFFKLKEGMDSAKKCLETSAVSKRGREEAPDLPIKRLSLKSSD